MERITNINQQTLSGIKLDQISKFAAANGYEPYNVTIDEGGAPRLKTQNEVHNEFSYGSISFVSTSIGEEADGPSIISV